MAEVLSVPDNVHLRAMKLRFQLLLLQAVIVCVTTLATGAVAGTLQGALHP